MTLTPGTRLGPYEIVGQIGAGGMGEVWKAMDTRLDRLVAVKVLPETFAKHPESLARFEREAKAVAALNHPNVLGIYDFGTDGEHTYAVMELLEGESLRERLKAGPMDPEEALEIARQVAAGLAVAHAKGIIHRDIKPENIFLTREGRVKVLDFGLAKQMILTDSERDGSTMALSSGQLTSRGMILGTIGYMSPEQVRGDAVDARADIFSFGVVLFEMLTGKRAFDRDSAPETMAAILRDAPTTDGDSGKLLPPALCDLLDRCLEKKPDRRLSSMQELSAGLARLGPQPSSSNLLSGGFLWPRRRWVLWGATAASLAILLAVAGLWKVLGRHAHLANEASIAVLPFEDMSEGKNQEYLSDGISEELLNLLAKIPALHVISRTSAFSFKGRHLGIPEIARQLKVAKILEGSVRKSGNRVRITVQLIDARTDTHLWSETYDRKIDDLFTVQDEIAAAVVGQLKVTLLGAPLKTQKVDPKAHDLFLQAIQIARKGELGGTAQSIGLLKMALAIAPDYGTAWQLLASYYISEVDHGVRPAEEGLRLAREAVDKALAIDPEDALANVRLAEIEMDLDGNLAGAAKHLERAWALDPIHASRSAADLASQLGRVELAIALAQSDVEHDPIDPGGYSRLGGAHFYAGHFDEALANYRTALNLSPQMTAVHSAISMVLLLKGDGQGALAEIQREPAEVYRLMSLPLIYHALGQTAKSDAALAEMIRKYGHDNPYNVASALAFRREADRAFEQLDQAVRIHDSGLPELAVEPMLANLHGDRRWLPLLRKLGKAPEQLAAIKFDVRPPGARVR